MRFLKYACICISLGLILYTSGCKTDQQPEKTATNDPSLMKVSFYRWVEYTEYHSVEFKTHTISALIPDLGRKWRFYETNIKPSSENQLRELIDKNQSKLRNFQPRSEWFKEMPPPDMGTFLVIEWGDKHVSYAIPPKSLRSGLSETAKQTYQMIDTVSRTLIDMTDEYGDKTQILYVKKNDKIKKEIERELDRELALSLPKDRIGW